MIFNCPDCRRTIDSRTQMRRCGPFGHEPCVAVDDGTGNKFVEAKKPERQNRNRGQSDFYLVGWGETEAPHSVRRRR